MKFFKKYDKAVHKPDWQDNIARSIYTRLILVQQTFATVAGKMVNGLPVRTKKAFCILFTSILVVLNTWYIIKGVANKSQVFSSKQEKIELIRYYKQDNTNDQPVISQKDHQSIIAFKKYMDSL